MQLFSIWSSHNLVPLPSLDDHAWESYGLVNVNAGEALAWLGDCGRTLGWPHLNSPGAHAPSDTTITLPCGGRALLFSDATMLLARADGRVFPAPFGATPHQRPKLHTLSQRLAQLGDWPQEWTHGDTQGKLAPSYRAFSTVLSPHDETLLTTLGNTLLTITHAVGATLEWQSQPVLRSGALMPPNVTLSGVHPTAPPLPNGAARTNTSLRALINAMLAHLWSIGHPIPALPGQSLRDGAVRTVASSILADAPPMASAHQRVHLESNRDVRELRHLLQGTFDV